RLGLARVAAEVVGVGPRIPTDHRGAEELALSGPLLVVEPERERGKERERSVTVAIDQLVQMREHHCLQLEDTETLALSRICPVSDLAAEAARDRLGGLCVERTMSV